MNILVVEDEESTRRFLSKGLREEGYHVALAADGEEGIEMALERDFDLMILDVMLPKKNGIQVCQRLRQERRTLPILMLTAKDTLPDRVEGLDSGADDYLRKPFQFEELLARLRALLRRANPGQQNVLQAGDLKIDLVARRATVQDIPIQLSNREFSLLQLFVRRKGHIMSRTVLLEDVWGFDFVSDSKVVDVYINYLRKKLKRVTTQVSIENHRNRGFSLDEQRS